jgi:hypothetical protein
VLDDLELTAENGVRRSLRSPQSRAETRTVSDNSHILEDDVVAVCGRNGHGAP